MKRCPVECRCVLKTPEGVVNQVILGLADRDCPEVPGLVQIELPEGNGDKSGLQGGKEEERTEAEAA